MTARTVPDHERGGKERANSWVVIRPGRRQRSRSVTLGTEDSGRGGHVGHARDVAGLASKADRPEVRRQWEARTGTASHRRGDRELGGANGRREAGLGLSIRRIQGALSNLGHEIARSTIAEILARHGIEPAPERSRKTTWKEFLSRHWEPFMTDASVAAVTTTRGLRDPWSFRGTRRLKFRSFGRRCNPWFGLGIRRIEFSGQTGSAARSRSVTTSLGN